MSYWNKNTITGVLIKKGGGIWTQTPHIKRTLCEDEHASTSQRISKSASKSLEDARLQAWNTFSLTAFKRNQPYQHLTLDFKAPEL